MRADEGRRDPVGQLDLTATAGANFSKKSNIFGDQM
jgi:hypothetical protein